jgi:hypothetical protein
MDPVRWCLFTFVFLFIVFMLLLELRPFFCAFLCVSSKCSLPHVNDLRVFRLAANRVMTYFIFWMFILTEQTGFHSRSIKSFAVPV